jgi:GDP-L-fucose synthase
LYKNKKILITGGTGMIGSHLIELLLSEGAKIRTIIHKRDLPKEIDHNKIEIMEGDLVDKKFSDKVVKDMDYVFHLAAYTGGLGRTSIEPATTLTPNLILDGNILDSSKN